MSRPAPKLTPGRLVYLAWHAPRGAAERALKEGPLNLWLSARGREAMERAAWTLPAAPAPTGDAPSVTFLTGDRYWYQTAFCAASLALAAGRGVKVEIVDDGSLSARQIEALHRILPGSRVISVAETEARLDDALPSSRFPTLRRHRRVYPHLRKITDVHAGRSGPRLVLDSDMLFFQRPSVLLDWLAAPRDLLHMVDVGDFYGYAPGLLAEVAGAPLPSRVNVGVCGMDSSTPDWDRLESWTKTLLDRAGPHYLLEQALVAMMAAADPSSACPAAAYVVEPTRGQSRRPAEALHHYVGPAKAWYFRFAWRVALERLQGTRQP